jgi:hypothetical protein
MYLFSSRADSTILSILFNLSKQAGLAPQRVQAIAQYILDVEECPDGAVI